MSKIQLNVTLQIEECDLENIFRLVSGYAIKPKLEDSNRINNPVASTSIQKAMNATGAESLPPAQPKTMNGTFVEALIYDVQVKSGTNKNGKPYTMYKISYEDRDGGTGVMSTFDKNDGKDCQGLLNKNAKLYYAQEGKYKTLKGVLPA
jgi:hypothetical protein